jgi:hypothetical protein
MATGAPILASGEYFDPKHVFKLLGHGRHNESKNERGVLKPRVERRYKLKENEFYASAIECGRYGIMLSLIESQLIDEFMLNKVPIPIPSADMISLYPNSFPVRGARQMNQDLEPGKLDNYEIYAPFVPRSHKIYAPFLEKSASSTIPNNIYVLLNYFPVRIKNITKTPSDFEFYGKQYSLPFSELKIYRLTISGVISSGNDSIKTKLQREILAPESEKIREIFGILTNDKNSLFIVLPNYCLNLGILQDYSDDPLIDYLKNAIFAMTSDSVLKPFIRVSSTQKFRHIFYKGTTLLTIFYRINLYLKNIGHENAPFMVINDLCRATVSARVANENAGYSNNESNYRSYPKKHLLHTQKLRSIYNSIYDELRPNINSLIPINKERRTKKIPEYKNLIKNNNYIYKKIKLRNNTKKNFLNKARNKFTRRFGRISKTNLANFLNTVPQETHLINEENIRSYLNSVANT